MTAVEAAEAGTSAFTFIEMSDYDHVASDGLAAWLHAHDVTITFTHAGQVLCLSAPDGPSADPRVVRQPFAGAIGLAADGADTIWVSGRWQLWCLRNTLPSGETTEADEDRVYVPRVAHTTGYLGIHDIGLDSERRPVFVNTLFSCLAHPSTRHNFEPLWMPRFISRLVPEDRCHLNGVALDGGGQPAYVTSVSTANRAEGWREHRRDGGVVIDVASDAIVATGLSMPHSPRLHNGRLLITEAGHGRLTQIDLDSGRTETIMQVGTYLRGMTICDNHAIVGASGSRTGSDYEGLPLHDYLTRTGDRAESGLYVVNLDTGQVEHTFTLKGREREVFNIATLPNTRKPLVCGPDGQWARNTVAIVDLRDVLPG